MQLAIANIQCQRPQEPNNGENDVQLTMVNIQLNPMLDMQLAIANIQCQKPHEPINGENDVQSTMVNIQLNPMLDMQLAIANIQCQKPHEPINGENDVQSTMVNIQLNPMLDMQLAIANIQCQAPPGIHVQPTCNSNVRVNISSLVFLIVCLCLQFRITMKSTVSRSPEDRPVCVRYAVSVCV
jgi:hypothetical protein